MFYDSICRKFKNRPKLINGDGNSNNSGCLWRWGSAEGGTGELFGMVGMFHILIGMLDKVYVFIKTHRTTHLQPINFIVCTFYCRKKNCGIK